MLHRSGHAVLPHRNPRERNCHGKSAALTLNLSVQCFRKIHSAGSVRFVITLWMRGARKLVIQARYICHICRKIYHERFAKADEGFSKNRQQSRRKLKSLSGGTVNEDTRRSRVRGEEAARNRRAGPGGPQGR